MNSNSILVTLISGLTFLVGYFIEKKSKNKHKSVLYSIGLAFTTLLGLILFDLLPEVLEIDAKWYITLLYIFGGIATLKLFDLFIPEHEHSNKRDHTEHISTISCIAIIIHNLIEYCAIYMLCTTNLSSGILMAVGVAFHNIPFSIQINGLSYNKSKQILMTILLIISCVISGLLIGTFDINITENILGILTSITLGMAIYIAIFELMHEAIEHIKTKEVFYGVSTGLLLTIIMILLG